MSETVLLPLDQARIIPLTINGRVVRYHFGVIAEKDWLNYFAAITNQSIQREGRREMVYDDSCAADELVRSTVRSVDGYSSACHGEWRRQLPIVHVSAVAIVLGAVSVETKNDDELTFSDLIEVSLTATWSQNEAGKMSQYSGLIHRFSQPTAVQLKRYRTECARTWISGSSKEPVTNYPARQIIAAKLYDEMIQSVEGYSVHGHALTDDVAEIRRHMDTLHKAAAVMQVFSPRGEDVMIGTKADETAEE